MIDQPNDRFPLDKPPLKKADWWLIAIGIFIIVITFPVLWRLYRFVLPIAALGFIIYFAIRFTQLGKIAGSASSSAYPSILLVWNELVLFIRKYLRSFIITTILVLAFAVAGTLFFKDYSKKDDTKNQLERIALSINKFKTETGNYPTDLGILIGNDPLKKEWLRDFWGNAIVYSLTNNGQGYTLRSLGNDGVTGTEDDVFLEK